jgi:hypothetical protein
MELHDRLDPESEGVIAFSERPCSGVPELPPPDVYDPVVEAYKKDVDRTLLIENLKLTPEQRSQKFLQFMEAVYEVRRAGELFRARETQSE